MEIVHIKLGDQLSTKINEIAAKENTTAAEIGKNILTQYLFDDSYKMAPKIEAISKQMENIYAIIEQQNKKSDVVKPNDKLIENIHLIGTNFSAVVKSLDDINKIKSINYTNIIKVGEAIGEVKYDLSKFQNDFKIFRTNLCQQSEVIWKSLTEKPLSHLYNVTGIIVIIALLLTATSMNGWLNLLANFFYGIISFNGHVLLNALQIIWSAIKTFSVDFICLVPFVVPLYLLLLHRLTSSLKNFNY